MLRSIGPMELIIILAIVVLLFGAKRIPEIAKGLGKGIREFKGGLNSEAAAAEEAKALKKPEDPQNPAPKT